MLKVEHLTKSYQTGSQVYPVLKDISLEVEKGESWGLPAAVRLRF